MGQLIIENQTNIWTIKIIDISGRKKTCNVTNGNKSEPISLASGSYSVTVTINFQDDRKIEKVQITIYEGCATIVILGLPPSQPVVKVVKMI